MGGTVGCCSSRDRNDKIFDIELRNDKFFYFNYPQLLSEIDQRLERVQSISNVSSADITHFKWVLSQLQLEIDYNQRNLSFETSHSFRKRLSVEVCSAEGFFKTAGPFSQCKSLVRLRFQGLQKKTKKNLNCSNPKFYEIFRFPLT